MQLSLETEETSCDVVRVQFRPLAHPTQLARCPRGAVRGEKGKKNVYLCVYVGTCNSDSHAAVETGGEEVIHGAQSLHLLIARLL